MTVKSRELLRRYEDGESDAATAIFDRYVARLIALAGSRIGARLKRRVDADDVVQSAYRSFFLHARQGEYQLANSGDLWRLLAKITLHKLYGQIEKQTADKRSIDRELSTDIPAANLQTPEPSPDEAVAIIEELQHVIAALSAEERQVLTARLQGQSVDEISASIGKSQRTTRRMLANAKRQIEQRLLDHDASGDSAAPSTSEVNAPLRYSDYVLEQLLGAGGMGKVFRAKEKGTGKVVAIKALHKSRQTDQRAVAQFVQEAQILAKLKHPHLVGVQGLGQFPSGGYFMVMDFVDGVDLRTQLRSGPLELSVVSATMRQVAAGIQHAHDHDIVHCDLKPENVLLDPAGRAVVTDFGFAYIVAGASTATTIGGTIGYIAPEILRLEAVPAHSADIYGMGMLMWTLLTNKPPELLSAEGTDDAAHTIIRRCVAVDPAQRYRSARDFARELELLAADCE